MTRYYTLTFNTTKGRRSIRINNPGAELPAGANAAIAQIIANDVFNPEKGSLESLNKLEMVAVDRSVLM
jgi:hypothetical protein